MTFYLWAKVSTLSELGELMAHWGEVSGLNDWAGLLKAKSRISKKKIFMPYGRNI